MILIFTLFKTPGLSHPFSNMLNGVVRKFIEITEEVPPSVFSTGQLNSLQRSCGLFISVPRETFHWSVEEELLTEREQEHETLSHSGITNDCCKKQLLNGFPYPPIKWPTLPYDLGASLQELDWIDSIPIHLQLLAQPFNTRARVSAITVTRVTDQEIHLAGSDKWIIAQ